MSRYLSSSDFRVAHDGGAIPLPQRASVAGPQEKVRYLAQRRKCRQVRTSKKKFFFAFLGSWRDQFSNSALSSKPESNFLRPHSNSLPPGEREPVSWIVQEAKYFVGLRWSNGVMESSTPILRHSNRPALLHESLFLGVAGELYAAIDAELLIDVVEMDLDRSLADEEFLADLHIA
jgi:hypothetical protein